MLYNVPENFKRMGDKVVRNHPNSWDVQVFKKVVMRANTTGTMGGLPNVGGIGVLDSQDEPEYTYEWLCNGWALRAEQFQPGNMTDVRDAAIGGAEEFPYMIAVDRAPLVPDGPPNDAQISNKCLVMFLIGEGPDAARLCFEVASTDSTMELPPFVPRYVLNRRDDLHVPAGPTPTP